MYNGIVATVNIKKPAFEKLSNEKYGIMLYYYISEDAVSNIVELADITSNVSYVIRVSVISCLTIQ